MAQSKTFACTHCDFGFAAWSDGNPYYIDADGEKQYAYHPDHKNLDRCIGNDEPHLCLDCAEIFNSDTQNPATACPTCQHPRIIDCYRAESKLCPKCKQGRLERDPDGDCIS